jgi:nucleotide-binding universal stress UspA family protein
MYDMESHMYKRIVVPLDGSEIAEAALVEAEKMAQLTGAPIHMVRVIDFNSKDFAASYGMLVEPSAISVLLEDEAAAVRQYLEVVYARIAEQGFTVTSEVRRGIVYEQIIATTRPGDLIVMASHGRNGISRWFLGSVAEEVVRRSNVPVLLLRKAPQSESVGKRIASAYSEHAIFASPARGTAIIS